MTDITPAYEDEIELIDIFRILWKWKILIVLGTMFFGLTAVFVSLQLPKIYKAEMTIQPGVLKVNEHGQRNYINSLKDIVGRIDAGLYDNAIILTILKNTEGVKPIKLKFDSNISTDSNVLTIGYETPDLKEGHAVLNYLFNLILKEEAYLVSGIIDDYNHRIGLNKFEVEKSKSLIKSYEKNERSISKRMNEIHEDIKVMSANSDFLSYERKKLLERKEDVNGSLSVLLYSNTIQQSIQFVNTVKKDLNEHHARKEAESQKIIVEKDRQKRIIQATVNLEKERDRIVNMKMLIPPEYSRPLPVKPNRKLIVLLSIVAGLFFWIFCSFIIEYLKNNTLSEAL